MYSIAPTLVNPLKPNSRVLVGTNDLLAACIFRRLEYDRLQQDWEIEWN